MKKILMIAVFFLVAGIASAEVVGTLVKFNQSQNTVALAPGTKVKLDSTGNTMNLGNDVKIDQTKNTVALGNAAKIDQTQNTVSLGNAAKIDQTSNTVTSKIDQTSNTVTINAAKIDQTSNTVTLSNAAKIDQTSNTVTLGNAVNTWYKDKVVGGYSINTTTDGVKVLPTSSRLQSMLVAVSGTSSDSVDVYLSTRDCTMTILGGETFDDYYYFLDKTPTINWTVRGTPTLVRIKIYWIIE